uniref:splicing factor, arginine/serine-rich 19-like n=1 Tax=Podarcis muralis TaxID=64176 RepID=UPI00109F6D5A|nr:splicing factor, arginine/serine-rich 19-like [Podarcis muralis]
MKVTRRGGLAGPPPPPRARKRAQSDPESRRKTGRQRRRRGGTETSRGGGGEAKPASDLRAWTPKNEALSGEGSLLPARPPARLSRVSPAWEEGGVPRLWRLRGGSHGRQTARQDRAGRRREPSRPGKPALTSARLPQPGRRCRRRRLLLGQVTRPHLWKWPGRERGGGREKPEGRKRRNEGGVSSASAAERESEAEGKAKEAARLTAPPRFPHGGKEGKAESCALPSARRNPL